MSVPTPTRPSARIPIAPPGNLPQTPIKGEAVHGGFRSNRHYDAIEELADERGMGRELLRQTSGDLQPPSIMTQGHDEMMNSVTPQGKENYKVSKAK